MSETMRPLALLSNDDGYRADGLHALRAALSEVFDVVVCAPDSEQSASSHSLTLHRPLRVHRHGDGLFSVDGTPADSIYVALHSGDIVPRRPALVVSGMNHGLNLGLDAFYSGTVAAAREGALQGYPALAVSADREAHREAAARMATRVAQAVLESCGDRRALFSINFPRGREWKLVATRLGRRVYEGGLVRRDDPRGRPYYWIGGSEVRHEDVAGSDTEAYDQGAVGLTPLLLDLWDESLTFAADSVVSEYQPQ